MLLFACCSGPKFLFGGVPVADLKLAAEFGVGCLNFVSNCSLKADIFAAVL